MRNAIKVGQYILNADNVLQITLPRDFGENVVVDFGGGHYLEFPGSSAEGKALAWYFGESDRALHKPGVTVDVVAEHRMAVAEGTVTPEDWPTFKIGPDDDADAAYAESVRNHYGIPVGVGQEGGAA